VAFGSGETGNLSLPSVPREADVREGDLIVTSGLGDRFPGGYPVAQVTAIDREEGLTFALVVAEPLAALDRGREVLLIDTPERVVTDPETIEQAITQEESPEAAPDEETSEAVPEEDAPEEVPE